LTQLGRTCGRCTKHHSKNNDCLKITHPGDLLPIFGCGLRQFCCPR
jgi:hypothetical protein